MKSENKFEYEKPELMSYRFAVKFAVGDDDEEPSAGGDITEVCDSGWDE